MMGNWLHGLGSRRLPVRNGQGLILDGKLPPVTEVEHYQLRVLYYSPLAMLAGTLNPKQLTVGGQYGVRFLIDASGQLTEHEENDGPLYSDSIRSRLLTPAQLLPRQDEEL